MPKRKQLKTKIVHEALVSYPSALYFSDNENFWREAAIDKLAAKYGGKDVGSGMGFGFRDLNLEFKTKLGRDQFVEAARNRRKGMQLSQVRKYDSHDEVLS